MPRVLVIIPAYNEAETLAGVIGNLQRHTPDYDILVVDDGSRDDTAHIARAFHNVMQDVQLSRQRNGAYGWSIARDIADPELWTERYHCPTWLEIRAATARFVP